MRYCLCCGKELHSSKDNASPNSEISNGWHTKCVKSFFQSSSFPAIDLSEESLHLLVNDGIQKGYTVPGVQKKLSLQLTGGPLPKLTFVDYPTGYILKPQANEYSKLPEMEYLIMQMAKSCNIKTVPFALVQMSNREDLAYITKRIDRKDGQILA